MKNLLHIIFLFFTIQNCCEAQELISIQTDRPDQTECPFITPVHYFQFENGFNYEKTIATNTLFVVPTILTRFGISPNFELRMLFEFTTEKNISGLNPVYVGFKTNLCKEKGVIPTTSFIAHIGIPNFASNNLKTTFYMPEFRFTMQHSINNKQTLSYNIGAEWNGETAEPTFVYTLATGYTVTEKVGIYIELYGFLPQIEKPDHRFDGGLTYLMHSNHQLDISYGVGLSKTSLKYFISLGYSFRFKI